MLPLVEAGRAAIQQDWIHVALILMGWANGVMQKPHTVQKCCRSSDRRPDKPTHGPRLKQYFAAIQQD